MNGVMNSRFCSIDFTFGSLILIAKENNSDFALVQDKFLNSENFIKYSFRFLAEKQYQNRKLKFFYD